MARIGRSELKGLDAARQNFARLPQVCRERFGDATKASAKDMVTHAKLLVPKRTGALQRAIAYAFDKRSGLAFVGIQTGAVAIAGGRAVTKARAAKLGSTRRAMPRRYAHLVEFGSSRSGARPFIAPAANRVKPNFERAMRGSGPQVERDLSASRFV